MVLWSLVFGDSKVSFVQLWSALIVVIIREAKLVEFAYVFFVGVLDSVPRVHYVEGEEKLWYGGAGREL